MLAPRDLQRFVRQHDIVFQRFELRRRAGLAHGDPRAGRVEHADRLVGQLAPADITVRQAHRVHHRLIEDFHAMVLFQGGDHAAQHANSRIGFRFLDLDHLEAARQRGVALDVFLVFGPGGGGDGAQFAARQRRFEQIGGVALPFHATGADQLVRLVDEQDDRRA